MRANNFNPPNTIPTFFNIANACLQTSPSQALAVTLHNATLGVETLSYGQLNDLSDQMARQLASSMNVVKGDRIALALPNCAAFPIFFFAVLKLGAIAVPLTMQLTRTELSYICQDAEPTLLITSQSFTEKNRLEDFSFCSLINVGDGQLKDLDAIATSRPPADTATSTFAKTRAEDPAYLVYTSGTTGRPKGVLHAHRALLGRLPASEHWFDYSQTITDKILHSGKLNWTYVLGTGLMDPLYQGKSVVLYEGGYDASNDASVWPQLIAEHECSIFIAVPTIYRQILQKTPCTLRDVPTLRHCMSAGEHLEENVLALWQERFEQSIYEALGMSECSYYLSQPKNKGIAPGAAGLIQPGHMIELLDENFKPVADHEEGQLCIHRDDPGLFLRYWNQPSTKYEQSANYFATGDYAYRDENGYHWLLGRKDDIINSFGYRISPHEIERTMKSHPAIAECIAIGEAIENGKVIVTLAVQIKDASDQGKDMDEGNDKDKDKKSDLAEILLGYGREHLASYKAPKRIMFVDGFPRTANGKIQRKRIVLP